MANSSGISGAPKLAFTSRHRGRWSVRRSALYHLSAGVALLIAFVFGLDVRAALGQDDWDAAKKTVDQPQRQVMMVLPNFDQWVLGGRTREQISRAVKSQLDLQLESVTRACELSAAQREKLELAGEGDVKRLYRTIEEFREKFSAAGQDQQKASNVVGEAQTLMAKLQSGVYDDSSLFHKVLRQTLNGEQSARYEQQERERRKFHYEAKIELVLSNLENSISLRADQRQRLLKLLIEETEPPKKTGQYDFYIVLFQASRLGEAKLRPILDEGQWQSLKKMLNQYQGMERFLKTQGYLQ